MRFALLYKSNAGKSSDKAKLASKNESILLCHPFTSFPSRLDEKENNDNQNQGDKDALYDSALEIIRSEGKASTSFLQRKLQIGYNRAARIIDMMEADGIVSKANHVGKRDLLQ